mgnify:CR=1 FL=1
MSACIATTSYLRSSFDEKIRRRVKERHMATLEEKLRWRRKISGHRSGKERLAYASLTWLIGKVCKKALKGKDAVTIANELEEDDVGKVQRIMDVAKSFAPDYDVEEIYKKLME